MVITIRSRRYRKVLDLALFVFFDRQNPHCTLPTLRSKREYLPSSPTDLRRLLRVSHSRPHSNRDGDPERRRRKPVVADGQVGKVSTFSRPVTSSMAFGAGNRGTAFCFGTMCTSLWFIVISTLRSTLHHRIPQRKRGRPFENNTKYVHGTDYGAPTNLCARPHILVRSFVLNVYFNDIIILISHLFIAPLRGYAGGRVAAI